MYNWRKMTDEARDEVLSIRKLTGQPWHGPPHGVDTNWYHISAACFEHKPIIGKNAARMAKLENNILSEIQPHCIKISAWCVLPNHYHLLVQTCELEACKKALGHLHGKTSHDWNKEDGLSGRKCWHRCLPKRINSLRHRMATMNYIHHNPVHHICVKVWQDWPFSSAICFLEDIGRENAIEIWREYPIEWIGQNWDDPEL